MSKQRLSPFALPIGATANRVNFVIRRILQSGYFAYPDFIFFKEEYGKERIISGKSGNQG